MLSLFPALLSFSFFAPLLLRIGAGLAFLIVGNRRMRDPVSPGPKYLIALEWLIGALLIVGLFTQGAALVGILLILALKMFKQETYGGNTLAGTLLLFVCFSLLATGAGAFAIDLPL